MTLAERCHERAERTRVAARWLSVKRLGHLDYDLPRTLQAVKDLREPSGSVTFLASLRATFRKGSP